MYSEKDFAVINGRIRKNWLVLTPILVALAAAYVYALSAGIRWLAMAAGALLFVAACYGLLAYLLPNMRYRSFLESLENGLSRDVRGEIVAVSDRVEYQDGARVVPVRVRAEPDGSDGPEARHTSALAERLRLNEGEDTEAERIVYLNVSKRDDFPGPGARVKLCCCGRHIKRVESEA
ncbi:MAG: hypothetical protein IJH09_06105 [Clostridia bacterium]|nr:hypothetical protein [Clostridia bacterium]